MVTMWKVSLLFFTISLNLIRDYQGRKGLGAMKRPLSPTTAQEAAEHARKIAKLADDSVNQDFRTRTRVEYEEKRDEGGDSLAQERRASLWTRKLASN